MLLYKPQESVQIPHRRTPRPRVRPGIPGESSPKFPAKLGIQTSCDLGSGLLEMVSNEQSRARILSLARIIFSTRVVDPDPYPDPDSMRCLDPEPDPDSESGSGSRGKKKKKMKKILTFILNFFKFFRLNFPLAAHTNTVYLLSYFFPVLQCRIILMRLRLLA
jgi:hypothetical protein